MRNGAFLLLTALALYRVGALVNWDFDLLAEKFSNDLESGYQAPVDECDEKAVDANWGKRFYCLFKAKAGEFRLTASDKVQEVLPSPHSELVMGMVLGENQFKRIPIYNDILKRVGLVHVVVVSGYNISLVFALLMRVLGSQYKVKNLIIGLLVTLLYTGISGFGVPAVRAWIMGSIAVIFKFYGRPTQGMKILVFSAVVILILAPDQLFSVSFQLSFLATLGVMLVPGALETVFSYFGFKNTPAFLEDFSTSLGAQLAVNPVISYYFGTISLVSLVVNPLVLWVVPVCTVLGGALVLLVFISPLLAHALAIVMFPFLDLFVSFSEFFANFAGASVNLRFGFYGILTYYTALFLFLRFLGVKRRV